MKHLVLAAGHMKKHWFVLLSSAAALCLLLAPSAVSVMLVAAVFAVVVLAAGLDLAKPPVMPQGKLRTACMLLSPVLAAAGFLTFFDTWSASSRIAALAGALGLAAPVLLGAVALAGAILGLYAIYLLSGWTLFWLKDLADSCLPPQSGAASENRKRNWFFLLSAAGFFCLTVNESRGYWIGFLLTWGMMYAAAGWIPSLWEYTHRYSRGTKVLCAAGAVGVCLGNQELFCSQLELVIAAGVLPSLSRDCYLMASYLLTALGCLFVFICLLVFWGAVKQIFVRGKMFEGIRSREWLFYGILLAATLVFMIVCFGQTDGFYGTEYDYDIIYTSDSPTLVKGNVYVGLTHPQNDIRQPLFAVFAAPFVGISYLFGRIPGISDAVQAMLVNGVQVVLLFAANLMLAGMMGLKSRKRICFVLLTSVTYTQLLFVLMMEQYIIAYFWLILCLYLLSRQDRESRLALWGAGGTLLTSMVLLPFFSEHKPWKDLKAWFVDMVKYGLEFVTLMLVFCRFDVMYDFLSRATFLSSFTGKTVTAADKFFQYIQFVSSCFLAPRAGVNTTAVDHVSWQLEPAVGIHGAGVVIVLLVILSAVLNRKKKSSLLAAGWVGFSLVMLLGLGWGTAENGLILYALYFGWAYLVLLFQLAEKIGQVSKVNYLTEVLSIGGAALMAACNIPAIMEMVRFAMTYFPL